jgi:glucose/arabinose dehydrogenase
MMRLNLFLVALASTALAACGGSDPDPAQYGPTPDLPDRRTTLLPDMGILKPTGWGSEKPTVPAGYRIDAIATDLKIPRQTLLLPNGDILVAEGKGGGDAPAMRPKDIIAGMVMKKGTSAV